MNTESLEYFIKVYEKKSVKAAARDLFITPQGLGKIIKQLEKDLKTELFYRGAKGVEATEYGELAYARAKHICYLINDLKKEVNVMSESKCVINVTATNSISLVVPINLLFSFSKEQSNIQMKLREVPDEYSLEKIFDDEEVDIGLFMLNEKNDNFDYENIISGESVIVVSKNHPLSEKEEISIMDLEHEKLALKATELGEEHSFTSKCLEYGFTANIEYEISNIITAHKLCKSDDIILVSVDFIEDEIKDDELKIIRLKERIEQNIYLVSKKNSIKAREILQLKNYIKSVI